MIKRFLSLLLLAFLAWIFLQTALDYREHTRLSPLASHYASQGPAELGAPNLVTAVVVTYRGLDTLGEVTVLFISAAGVGLLLHRRREEAQGDADQVAPSEIVSSAAQLLFPVILLLGIYVFVNGHLTPGGGFQGGAIMASATMLWLLAMPDGQLGQRLFAVTESLSGFAYVVLGVLGVLLAGGFLDNRILPLGDYGALFSAGAIPVIYVLIGLKVGAELSVMLTRLRH